MDGLGEFRLPSIPSASSQSETVTSSGDYVANALPQSVDEASETVGDPSEHQHVDEKCLLCGKQFDEPKLPFKTAEANSENLKLVYG